MPKAKQVYTYTKFADRRVNVGASLKTLAKEMTDAGFPVGYATLWRWEVGKGEPNAVQRRALDGVLTRLENEIRRQLRELMEAPIPRR